MSITVVVRLRANQNNIDDVKRELKNLVGLTRKEAGCISYQLHQSIDNDAVFLFYETWADKSALDRHMESAHFKDWANKSKQLLAEPDQIALYKIIS